MAGGCEELQVVVVLERDVLNPCEEGNHGPRPSCPPRQVDFQLRAAILHSKAALGFIDYDTVATKWKSVVDLCHAEVEAATKATAEATGEPEAALGAAGADDGAAALARPKNGSGIDAATADDTAARREANRTVEANACIIIEPESTTELRSKLLSSTAGRVIWAAWGWQVPTAFL